uniref:Uncharacterized protein n=1 Tax=Craspedostauros australis TaxID=1486917 RepID=A0A7S0F6X0_9STRA|mmetsp:Transcript_8381/g.22686  ORF Transcript_8381/g.22686 Transcript_8381/m.22686 type:complete len:123 (+) Transcript_8381:55-423(+)
MAPIPTTLPNFGAAPTTSLSRAISMPMPRANTGSTSPTPGFPSAPPTGFNRHKSIDMLRSGLNPEAQNMQSAAIKSLQQRKAKRGLAKRLGQGKTTNPTMLQGSVPPSTFMRLNNLDQPKGP